LRALEKKVLRIFVPQKYKVTGRLVKLLDMKSHKLILLRRLNHGGTEGRDT